MALLVLKAHNWVVLIISLGYCQGIFWYKRMFCLIPLYWVLYWLRTHGRSKRWAVDVVFDVAVDVSVDIAKHFTVWDGQACASVPFSLVCVISCIFCACMYVCLWFRLSSCLYLCLCPCLCVCRFLFLSLSFYLLKPYLSLFRCILELKHKSTAQRASFTYICICSFFWGSSYVTKVGA